MKMENMPEQKTITAAAWKLAEWFERFSFVIKEKQFDTININSVEA